MRIAFFLASLVVVALAGYLTIIGYFLSHSIANLMIVAPLGAASQTVERPSDPLTLGYRGDPGTALSLPFQTISLETPLGPAEAWLVPAAGTEVGRAVYVHGLSGAREDGYRFLQTLHDAGWSVLLITYRNDADAPADPSGRFSFGLTEWPDLQAAVAQMAPEDTSPGVLVVADSMGGAILGQFLRQSPIAGRVKAAALDSPSLSFSAGVDLVAKHFGKPMPRLFALVAHQLLPLETGLDLHLAEVSAEFTAFPGPLFLAHGEGDQFVPVGPSQALAAARTAPTVTHWTKADHLDSHAEDPAAYTAAFSQFLSLLN